MHKQLFIRSNSFTAFSLTVSFLCGLPITELQYGTIVSHLYERGFLEKLLVSKEIHSCEQEHACASKKTKQKISTDLQGGLQSCKNKAKLNSYYWLCDQRDQVLALSLSSRNITNLKRKINFKRFRPSCTAIIPFFFRNIPKCDIPDNKRRQSLAFSSYSVIYLLLLSFYI